MAYRKLTGIDEKLLRTIWQLGARDGVRKVTARKVGALCGVSDYTVFCHFGRSNRAFLDAAAMHFFTRYLDPLLARMARGGTVGELWDDALDTLLSEGDGALYFQNYCAAFGLPDGLLPAERQAEAAAALSAASPGADAQQRRLLLDWFFTAAFRYAGQLSCGRLQNTAKVRSFLRAMICRTFSETK